MDENSNSLQPNAPQESPLNSSGPQPAGRSRKWPLLVGIVIILVLIVIVVVAYALQHNASTKMTSATTSSVTVTQPTPASQIDNASLQQDLNDIDAHMSQASQDQAVNDTSLSDQQNQISIPTN